VPDVAEMFETGNRKNGKVEKKEALVQGRKSRSNVWFRKI